MDFSQKLRLKNVSFVDYQIIKTKVSKTSKSQGFYQILTQTSPHSNLQSGQNNHKQINEIINLFSLSIFIFQKKVVTLPNNSFVYGKQKFSPSNIYWWYHQYG